MHDKYNEKGGFRGPMLLWRLPTSLGQSTGLDTGCGVRGHWVCQARASEWEDEAGVSQATVKHITCSFPRLQRKQSLQHQTC